ncbi:MAG: hypothetical protein J0H40_13550 [Rhizobiales bacterium]|nr:hypothetical protein [Hyphomicrobiales bacterium]
MPTTTVKVFHIGMPKEKLQAMPSEERGYLLSLGYAVNQVQLLQKLVVLSLAHEPTSPTEQRLGAAQSQMIIRFLVGMLHEARDLIRSVEASPVGRDYTTRMDQGGRDAFTNLENVFAESSLLTLIRNNFSFHPPNNKVLNKAFADAADDPASDELWSLYFSQHGFNSLFLVSDLMVIHGIKRFTKKQDMQEVQRVLMKNVVDAANNVFEYTMSFFAAAWIKHFGITFEAKEVVEVVIPSGVCGISIPFFVDMTVTERSRS